MSITPEPLVETDVISTRFPRLAVEDGHKDVLGELDAYCKYLPGLGPRLRGRVERSDAR